jgi:hypothetical protein
MDFSNRTETTGKNAPTEKSQDFCPMFMNSMEDRRRNPGSRPWTFKTPENPGSRPSTFANCEYQLWARCQQARHLVTAQLCVSRGRVGDLWLLGRVFVCPTELFRPSRPLQLTIENVKWNKCVSVYIVAMQRRMLS